VTRGLSTVSVVALTGAAWASLGAQSPVSAPPLVRASDALILASAGVGAALVASRDVDIVRWMRQPSFQTNVALRYTMAGARTYGDPGTVVLAAALWGGGRLTGDRGAALDGQRAVESLVLSGVVTLAVKGVAGRARPFVDSTNAKDFSLLRGFGGILGMGGNAPYQSFPSGHTTAAFAFASSITASMQRRSPRDAARLGPLLYGAAALTGLSRIYHHQHWASDVFVGAGIGTVGGLVVGRWHERHP